MASDSDTGSSRSHLTRGRRKLAADVPVEVVQELDQVVAQLRSALPYGAPRKVDIITRGITLALDELRAEHPEILS
jgi:hypothetical protein